MRRHHHVPWSAIFVNFSGLDRVMLPRVIRKILFHRPAVDRELAGPGRRNTRATDSLRRPVPKTSLCARKGRARRNPMFSSDGWLPAVISIPTPQSSKSLLRCFADNLKLHAAYSPLRHHLRRNSYVRKILLQRNCLGFCPACRARPAAIPVHAQFSSRAARAACSSAACREPLADHPVGLDSRSRFAGTSFNPPGYPLCE